MERLRRGGPTPPWRRGAGFLPLRGKRGLATSEGCAVMPFQGQDFTPRGAAPWWWAQYLSTGGGACFRQESGRLVSPSLAKIQCR